MVIKTGMVLRYYTSVIGISIPVHLLNIFIIPILVFQQCKLEHYADSGGKNTERDDDTHTHTQKYTVSPTERYQTPSDLQANFYYCCFFMAQIIETIHHVIHIMFSFAMQAHYSAASILAYITQSDKRNQSRFMFD